jgi:adenine-specific DNA-methyltransferase
MPEWMDYRTKQERSISLKSAKHKFDKPGNYKIMVKVVDIFGNDTTKILELTVK